MTITFRAALGQHGWLKLDRDGGAILRLDVAASEFPSLVKLSQYMDAYKGEQSFKVTIEPDAP